MIKWKKRGGKMKKKDNWDMETVLMTILALIMWAYIIHTFMVELTK